jgi:1,2-diacylglycerol 3-alpha-glucosyltransferase
MTNPVGDSKIAIACCGLGHVHRGVEVWAEDLATELISRGLTVTLYKGAGPVGGSHEVVVPCVKRGSTRAKALTAFSFPGKWRTRWASPYMYESMTFVRKLIKRLPADTDIVHTQDPYVASALQKACRKGSIKAKVILANGTEESCAFLSQFDYLQELDEYGIRDLAKAGFRKPGWFSIPNFVDTDRFCPVSGESEKLEMRRKYGIPRNAYVVLTVGAIQRQLKRTDWLIQECGRLPMRRDCPTCLVIVGARTHETAWLAAMARQVLSGNFRIITDVGHQHMPGIYQMSDVFAFCVTHGIYGIALAEAAATGLPCVVHDWERVKWVAGPTGVVINMKEEYQLARALERLRDSRLRNTISETTRSWAVGNLSRKKVVDKYVEMYESVLKERNSTVSGPS